MGAARIDQKDFQHSAFMKASAKTRGGSITAAPQNDSYSLPSHDALAQILPSYLGSDPQEEPEQSHVQDNTGKRLALCVSEDDLRDAPVTALHAPLPVHEVQRYRDALERMASDMISLRTRLAALEAENSRLRAHLAEFEDPGLDLLRDTDSDVMTKDELVDRIASLSCRLSRERSQSAAQSDRIQRLQNQLIRKNDSEKELLRTVLQRQPGFGHEQRRMRELEATVRHQGKVIERMERAQQSHNSAKNKQKSNINPTHRKGRAEVTPAAEDAGHRLELFRPPQPPTPPAQPQAPTKDTATMRERLGLLAELERTETRRHILEQQLEENSKIWGKQKQQMLLQLNEHKHGLGHASRDTQ